MAMSCDECGNCDQLATGTKKAGDICPYPSKRGLKRVSVSDFNKSGSKYLRKVPCLIEGKIDVYAVLDAFDVKCPARQHAVKKLLCSGIRGKGDVRQDLREALDAISRSIQMLDAKEAAEMEEE